MRRCVGMCMGMSMGKRGGEAGNERSLKVSQINVCMVGFVFVVTYHRTKTT